LVEPGDDVHTERLLESVTRWAETDARVTALALVGSCATGEAGPGSDVDLIVLSGASPELLSDTSWVCRFGDVRAIRLEEYGRVMSVRVHYSEGPEVEFGIADPDWAGLPLDEGTRRVLADGARVLYDRSGLLSLALRRV
jgi:predicted nucleotidyltransferase